DAREAAVLRLAGAEAQQPFDLGAALLRTTVLRLAADQHVLLLTMHHIVSDGWSIEVLIRELAALYTARLAGRPDPLPALAIQYADLAVWQREWLQGAVLEAELAYWRERLAGATTMLALPTDRPRPAQQTFHGARIARIVAPSLATALKELSVRE